MDLACSVDVVDDVSLVSVRLSNPAPVARRARVRNRLDGPVLPPRRAGVPAAGWDDDGCEVVVPPDGRVALGYACLAVPSSTRSSRSSTSSPPQPSSPSSLSPSSAPSPPSRPAPVELAAVERADPTDAEQSSTAADALRSLGDHRPPRDALPESVNGSRDVAAGSADRPVTPAAEEAEPSPDSDAIPADAPPDPAALEPRLLDPTPPGPVEAWLDAVEARVDLGERLADASVREATAATAELGGLSGVESLPERTARDARALRALVERAVALAERAESLDVPVDALRGLA